MHQIAALYHFAPVADPAALKHRLGQLCCRAGVRGTLIVASEGVNGTIAGTRGALDTALNGIKAEPGFADLEWKESTAAEAPFRKLKIKLKPEIVTLGAGEIDPRAKVGRYIEPKDWNALVDDPDTVLIDTRNDYEVAIGTFQGAVDPETQSFRDFPKWWEENKARFHNRKIAMFCTGGIRCEKSTSFLIEQGVEEVFHLRGGILKYLEEVPEHDTRWDGACFVFDERVSVEHGLREGEHTLCRACRRPVAPADLSHPAYVRGVSCPACIDEYTDADRTRFAERQRQIDLAKARGERHMAED
ncbi:MAG: rhodanese-related sulfurtransferase [Pseudomonadota bacterium]